MKQDVKTFWRIGEPFVWFSGATLAVTLVIALALLLVIVVNGMGVFWPHAVYSATLEDGTKLMGELVNRDEEESTGQERLQFKVGNRDLYGLDFRWIDRDRITSLDEPAENLAVERMEYGNFYGRLKGLSLPGQDRIQGPKTWEAVQEARETIEPLERRIKAKAKAIEAVNAKSERTRLKLLKLQYRGATETTPEVIALQAQQQTLQARFAELVAEQEDVLRERAKYRVHFEDINGRDMEMALSDIVRLYKPNGMPLASKLGFYLSKIKELFVAEPRESNTEGGLFPALFGTVMLVFLMSILSFPFGVIAGIYLREYAKDGFMVRLVRIAVNNLAGIPSIVYGVFGLGFFIYGIGGALDQVFFPERLPSPTFGTGGILWASLTLGLMTVPVVIIATEEAFGAIPRGVREASLALGATKFQTLTRVLLPLASPGILTGFILAMARAAGEVAPLMITGVVKLAPALPVDGHAPYLHMDRKFMHLGFHIYDIGFQSPNVEAAKPMVFVTTLLLVLVVLMMTGAAIRLRNRMKAKFAMRAF